MVELSSMGHTVTNTNLIHLQGQVTFIKQQQQKGKDSSFTHHSHRHLSDYSTTFRLYPLYSAQLPNDKSQLNLHVPQNHFQKPTCLPALSTGMELSCWRCLENGLMSEQLCCESVKNYKHIFIVSTLH